ncbi:MAG: hypothetical protein PUA83_07930 [Clostridiales bacterium]|nr:hypothetical protein [Clostridiales bacterium]
MTRNSDSFGLVVKEVTQESPKRLRVSGVVEGDRIYRADVVELESANGRRITACVQSIRIRKKRVDSADPGDEVTLTLPGLKKDDIHEDDRLRRSQLGGWKKIALEEKTEFPVNVMLLKKASRRYVRLSPENRNLRPIKIVALILAVFALFFSYRWILTLFRAGFTGFRAANTVLAAVFALVPAVMTVAVSYSVCNSAARRHICFDKTPVKFSGSGIELSYRSGTAVIRSEICFADIDSIEYYPRFGCLKVNAPVRLTKLKNGEVVGTKYESSPEKAFQVFFLIYIDNDLFMRTLSERSGVAIETVGSGKPEVDGARF